MKKAHLILALGAAMGLAGGSDAAPQAAKPAAAPQTAKPAATAPDVDHIIELLRKDVRASKADILGKTMALDASQAAAFWPVYKQYETESQALGDERLFIIQDFSDHYASLNDANAKGLMDRSFALEEKRLSLQKKYEDEFLKVLPAKVVARFFQVETRLNNLINLKVSSQIPLVD
ncbi:MAG: hypothetical protein ACHQNV_07245 [Vicinamibacteria bacterium]